MRQVVFSNSLAVKDIKIQKTFYEKLGFSVFAGELEKNDLIMNNGNALIGLFQGMFENNIITFYPDWNKDATHLNDFNDGRKN